MYAGNKCRENVALIWWPKPIYESLPYAASASATGISCVVETENIPLVVFGTLLVLVNAVVLKMRLDYRKTFKRRFAR